MWITKLFVVVFLAMAIKQTNENADKIEELAEWCNELQERMDDFKNGIDIHSRSNNDYGARNMRS